MTERRGGSDVGGATETTAVWDQGDVFRCEDIVSLSSPSSASDFMATSGSAPPRIAT